MASKYPSIKRFSVEGAEALVPALRTVLRAAATLGVSHVELGMAHRGRLNVLANILGKKSPLFAHFDDKTMGISMGDVKYHLGTMSTLKFAPFPYPHVPKPTAKSSPTTATSASATSASSSSSDQSHKQQQHQQQQLLSLDVSLSANPSHLEWVDPVVMGRARACQHYLPPGASPLSVLGVLVHGDASVTGQGLVAETLELSALRDYSVQGMVHVIVNNQIGFTTSPTRARSAIHPSDVAKAVGAPVFHVNADDPDAVVAVTALTVQFRMRFGCPAFIDLVCYRRRGHNELDEPAFTQPLMYRAIAARPTVSQLYGERLVEQGVISREQVAQMREAAVRDLEQAFAESPRYKQGPKAWLANSWQGRAIELALSPGPADQIVSTTVRPFTGVPLPTLRYIGRVITEVPPDFTMHGGVTTATTSGTGGAVAPSSSSSSLSSSSSSSSSASTSTLPSSPTGAGPGSGAAGPLQRLLEARRRSVLGGKGISWATAEALALGSLAMEGHHVRLSGQDVQRGTFNQRHAVWTDQVTEGTLPMCLL